MASKQQKEELIKALKFTPRTYKVMLSGYGGEIVLGSINREKYEYFRDNGVDLEEYAFDWDNEQEVPDEMQPFTPGEWHDCDDVAHESGCEFSNLNYITVFDETGNEVWSCPLGHEDLEKHKIKVEESEERYCSDRNDPDNTVGFIGQSVEKGVFFEGDIDLKEPFDPSKLSIYYSDIEGWCLVNSVSYNGEDVDGFGGYDTRGKTMEVKFWDTGEED